jgi:hypothetical protein
MRTIQKTMTTVVGAVTQLLVVITITRVAAVAVAAATTADAFQTAAVVVIVVACVQTVSPQSGRVSCDLLTRRICTRCGTCDTKLKTVGHIIFAEYSAAICSATKDLK